MNAIQLYSKTKHLTKKEGRLSLRECCAKVDAEYSATSRVKTGKMQLCRVGTQGGQIPEMPPELTRTTLLAMTKGAKEGKTLRPGRVQQVFVRVAQGLHGTMAKIKYNRYFVYRAKKSNPDLHLVVRKGKLINKGAWCCIQKIH